MRYFSEAILAGDSREVLELSVEILYEIEDGIHSEWDPSPPEAVDSKGNHVSFDSRNAVAWSLKGALLNGVGDPRSSLGKALVAKIGDALAQALGKRKFSDVRKWEKSVSSERDVAYLVRKAKGKIEDELAEYDKRQSRVDPEPFPDIGPQGKATVAAELWMPREKYPEMFGSLNGDRAGDLVGKLISQIKKFLRAKGPISLDYDSGGELKWKLKYGKKSIQSPYYSKSMPGDLYDNFYNVFFDLLDTFSSGSYKMTYRGDNDENKGRWRGSGRDIFDLLDSIEADLRSDIKKYEI